MAGLDSLTDDTGAPAAAEPPAPIPMGAAGASSAGGALSALDPYGQGADRVINRYVDPNMAARAYTAGALTPGNFGASMRGALTELNQAKKDEADLKMRYIPIVEASIQARQQRQLAMQQAARTQDLALGNAALGAVAPFLSSGQPITKDMMAQVLANAVQTGRTDQQHAQQLYGTLPDDPDELRRHLTGQVQAAVDPFGQHLTKLSPGQSLVNPLTGQTAAQSKKWTMQTIDQGNTKQVFAVNESNPTERIPIGTFDIHESPDVVAQQAGANWRTMQEQSGQNARAKDANAIEAAKADPYGTLGINKNVSPSAAAGAGLSGEDFLKTLPPNLALQVKAMSDGRLQISPNQRSPQQQQLIQLAMQYEPGTDQTIYASRAATAKDAASGTLAKSNNALNTLAGHLAELHDAADALHNTPIPWVNGVKNWASDAMGDPRLKTFNTNVHGVIDEFEKVYRSSGGTQAGIDEWKKNLGDANSPEQFRAVMAKGAEMVESKLEANNAQYAQGMSGKVGSYSSITPKAQAAFDKIRGVQTTAKPTATATATPTVPDDIKAIIDKHTP
jgi:hypothetical protein